MGETTKPKPKRKPKRTPVNKAVEAAPENKAIGAAPENKALGPGEAYRAYHGKWPKSKAGRDEK